MADDIDDSGAITHRSGHMSGRMTTRIEVVGRVCDDSYVGRLTTNEMAGS